MKKGSSRAAPNKRAGGKAKSAGGKKPSANGRKSSNPRRRRSLSRRNRLPRTAEESRDLSVKHPPKSVWMIIEINDDGENLFDRYEIIEAEIISVFGETTAFFIPSYIEKVKDKVIGIDLIGGYVFVERTESSEGIVVSMSSPYLKGRMKETSRSATITGASINEYKKRLLQSIKDLAPKKGSLVVPRVGTFKNVEGKVVSVARDRRSATVVFRKSSRIVQAPVSVLNLEPSRGSQ